MKITCIDNVCPSSRGGLCHDTEMIRVGYGCVNRKIPNRRSMAWRSFERRCAQLFGGIRCAFSGAQPALTGTRGDVRHPYLYVEAKYRQRHSIASLMRDTKIKADAEKKIPVVVLKEHQQRGCIIAVHSDDLERLCKAGDYSDLPLFREVQYVQK